MRPSSPAVCAVLLAAALGAAPRRAAAAQESTAAVQALGALYDLDYGRALSLMGAAAAAHPDEALYPLFDAGVLWWWASGEPGLFESSAPLAGRFRGDLAAVRALTGPRLEDPDPRRRADALFAAGLAEGIEAQDLLQSGRWFKAYLAGRRGRKLLLRCLETDPGYYDADLGIGIYDYLAAHLPGVLKIGALLFVRGDAAGGLERLRLAARHGRYAFAATQAASNLVSIDLLYQSDPAEALQALAPLLAAYPDSPYFRFVQVVALYEAGRWEESRSRAFALWELSRRDPAAFAPKRVSTLCGLDAARCFSKPALSAAAAWLTRAIDDPAPAPEAWRLCCRVYRGAAYELLGRRDAAKADFDAVASSASGSAQERAFAARCRDAACRAGDVEAFLRGEHAG
ncbi:MAG: hypothetical protein KGL53_02355 [Elusimicrobia bacterium]|nr:hypothetical protein [Elusimicrobiota bacterium]